MRSNERRGQRFRRKRVRRGRACQPGAGSRRLGGFALAAELVAAWLAAHKGVSGAAYLQRLGLDDFAAVLDLAGDEDVEPRRHDHERRLDAAPRPTLRALRPAERRAMEYAALLAPDHVPLPWPQTLAGQDFPKVAVPPPPTPLRLFRWGKSRHSSVAGVVRLRGPVGLARILTNPEETTSASF